MIGVTCRTGERCRLDPAVIERVEAIPETLVVLVDGTHLCVTETVEQVVTRIRDARASEVVACYALDRGIVTDPIALDIHDLLSEIADTRPTWAGRHY